jgi:hypothetical protein
MKKFSELQLDELTSARRFLKRELPHLSDAEINELLDDLLRVSDDERAPNGYFGSEYRRREWMPTSSF